MWCIVNLPNGTQQAVVVDPKAIGQECLEKVCKALNMICEMEYFGLEHWSPNLQETRTHQWINLRNRLTQDSSSSSSSTQLMLALRVKFWVPIHLILQESVRNLFYMQAKADLLEGRLMSKNWKHSAKLGALLCQADGIRFNEASLTAKCPLHIKEEIQKNEKKDKEQHVSAFKKRRLSKQKSMEHFDVNPNHPALVHQRHSLDTNSIIFHNNNNRTSTTNSIDTSIENEMKNSPLNVYQNYIIKPYLDTNNIPDEFLKEIAIEHGKLAKLNTLSKSAKYWLLKEIQELSGYGEDIFNGIPVNENNAVRCDLAVGPQGITVYTGDDKYCIPFSAIAAAKSFRRTFKLEYLNDLNEHKELEIKLQKQCMAAALYRSITEKHAFYVCDKVRVVVTNQFTRDLKGTIASMFKEDTELGKRYVFDIQRTCREVHDQARRRLYELGIITTTTNDSNDENEFNEFLLPSTDLKKIDEASKAVIEKYVDSRITEAMTCKICMDNEINSIFNPCGHIIACRDCALKCEHCPNCRTKITNVSKIFLPTELRTVNIDSNNNTSSNNEKNSNTIKNNINKISSNDISKKISVAA